MFKDFAFDNDKTLFIFSSEPAVAGHFQLQADAVVAFKHVGACVFLPYVLSGLLWIFLCPCVLFVYPLCVLII